MHIPIDNISEVNKNNDEGWETVFRMVMSNITKMMLMIFQLVEKQIKMLV